MEKVYYYDHSGNLQFTFNDPTAKVYVGLESDLKDWEISYENPYGRIKDFRRSKQSYTLPIVLPTDSTEVRDNLIDIFTADMLAEKPGKLVINGWELECYITQAKHDWVRNLDRIITFTVTPTYPVWLKKTTYNFDGIIGGGGGTGENLGRDYTETYTETVGKRGYNYGYSVTSANDGVVRLNGEGNGFIITLYGPAPGGGIIYLNGYPINVYRSLASNEIMVITSNGGEKTIKVYQPDGTEEDAFNDRDKEQTPFISIGSYTEITYGQVKFDFTAIERRSEPAWT